MPDLVSRGPGRGRRSTRARSPRNEPATVFATRVQMWSALAAAVAAIAALGVSVRALNISDAAWRNQRALNAQQMQLNADSARRDQQIYSSRVSLWATVGTVSSTVLPGGLDVHVQNRAPVPLHNVRIVAPLASNGTASVDLGDLPPCVIDTLRIAPPPGELFAPVQDAWLGYTGLQLVFSETSRWWRVRSDRIELLPGTPGSAEGPKLERANRKAVGDCGEGS
jgi:hypothetical protein